jgi:hypothetical protein
MRFCGYCAIAMVAVDFENCIQKFLAVGAIHELPLLENQNLGYFLRKS